MTGQDGSYLAELLLEKGYEVHGVLRRSSGQERNRFRHLSHLTESSSVKLHYADLSDPTAMRRILNRVQPDELYHLAGQSHVGLSFEIPESTFHEVAGATLSLLEMCRDLEKPPRLYQAGSSEVFGNPTQIPQTEETPFCPVSPYGCAKAFSVNLCRVYRESYGLHVSSGISYNHESIRRGSSFVTKKITSAAVRISQGCDEVLELGNLEASRDWGYAPEFVDAMWRMLQQEKASEFILATGKATRVRDFVVSAFDRAGFRLEFEGEGVNEVGRDSDSGRELVRVNAEFFRPADPQNLVGNPQKAKDVLGWEPKEDGHSLAARMVADEIEPITGS